MLSLLAFGLMGLRLLTARLYFQYRKIQISCYTVNMFHLWYEFAIFLTLCLYYKSEIYANFSPTLFSFGNLISESFVTMIYMMSMLLMNSSINNRQSYFTFNNQFILAPTFVFIGLLLRLYMTLTVFAYGLLVLIVGFFLKLIYFSCKSLLMEN